MPKHFWRSLRSRILLLAVLTILFLAGAAFSFFTYLRSSHTAVLAAAERHLMTVASGLARTYVERPPEVPSLSSVDLQPLTPLLPSELTPADRPKDPPPPPPPHPPLPTHQPSRHDPLSMLTARALREEGGIEGGFYAAKSSSLVGYAFPTHEGPGPNKEMPQREVPTIAMVAREAVANGSAKSSRFEGPHDAVLFVAVPIRERMAGAQAEITGAVWVMQRMPGVTGGRNREMLWGSLGFGAAALITALLTFFVTGEVSKGVSGVLARLNALESGFFAPMLPVPVDSPLEEFDRVLRGIDALAASLQQKIQKERMLEAEMRHKERLSALGQFAAGIAHELRNPLATIRLRTQMSQRTGNLEGVARNSLVIVEEVDRLDTMISRLLYFARPIHLQLQPVALDELCSTTVDAWIDRGGSQGVHVSCEGCAAATILCDRGSMLQVLDNLTDNAVQAASQQVNGNVSLSTSQDDSFAYIHVRDNGGGLDTKALRHAMDPFFTTKASGTGLGLSIAFEIVQAHDGELVLSNHPEGGALASVRLPLPAPELVTKSVNLLKGQVHG